jgi:hypothetical protein
VRLHFKAATSAGTTCSDLYDPEKLYFYTDTSPELDSNTDAWPKQLGVDYGYVTREAMAPSDPTSIAKSANGNVSAFKAPEEPCTQPLLGAFTYHLQPASLAANVTAGVATNPIGAVLRTITIMIGVTSTPAIDLTAGPHGTIYLVAMSRNSSGVYFQRLHAIDITTGAEQFAGPVDIAATYPSTGDNSSNGNVVFDPGQYKSRPGILISDGVVYTSWGSHCDDRRMRWTVRGANAIIALRCCHLNGRFEDYWEARRAA